MDKDTELTLNGTLCDRCRAFIDSPPPGRPRRCPSCQEQRDKMAHGGSTLRGHLVRRRKPPQG